jgi:hypothetical protein
MRERVNLMYWVNREKKVNETKRVGHHFEVHTHLIGYTHLNSRFNSDKLLLTVFNPFQITTGTVKNTVTA